MRFNEQEIDNVEMFLDKELGLSNSLGKALQQVKEGKITAHCEVRKKY